MKLSRVWILEKEEEEEWKLISTIKSRLLEEEKEEGYGEMVIVTLYYSILVSCALDC